MQNKPKKLSPAFYDEMKKLEPRYPTKVALLLPALHAAQRETRWLSGEVMDEIADFIGIHPAQVREVASFYTMYYLKPVGRSVLRICTNVACCLRGGEELIKHCEEKLDIACGETTQDGQFTLMEEECLGACGTAPAMMLVTDNGTGTYTEKYIENLDTVKIDQLLESLRSGDRA